ncbi:ABC transporter ATP-binding protein [[Micrococcus luteus] ATCC 49442]|uniref:ABC transporter ATP-binding protein n=1 Tax=[Micrococcus luteus] ATCC 49442 TaxID=2698727 RepID=UPI001FCB9DA5|nr:ABC transporter ATP-binding protein [[Micrococcus luteus] ATCC 49442]
MTHSAQNMSAAAQIQTEPGDTLASERPPLDDSQVVVQLQSVRKTYPNTEKPAVAGVDVAIRKGEFFSILGSSGSGKTTTLKMIAGFEHPTDGVILLDGQDVTGVPPNKRDVNTVFQNYALFPHMTVRANVAYPLQMARVPKAEIKPRVDEALSKVAMAEYDQRLPHQLSGGQKQRVALARALVGRPKLLLLDEPLGALDLKLRETMLVVLKNLQRNVGITFVYVTHDQGEALAMSDRVAVMNNGAIEQIGSPQEIYQNPATSFVASFIGKTNLFHCDRESDHTARKGNLSIAVSESLTSAKATVSVRPESIEVGAAAQQSDNVFNAVVEEVIYFGHEQELSLLVEGEPVVARVRGADVRRGQTITVGWPSHASVVVEGKP